jgi:hypothetical protein
MGAKAFGFLLAAPRCVRATRWGRDVCDPGRPGIVQRTGKVEILWHPQTKGRETANTNIDLEPAGGRCGYKRKRSVSQSDARNRIGE